MLVVSFISTVLTANFTIKQHLKFNCMRGVICDAIATLKLVLLVSPSVTRELH